MDDGTMILFLARETKNAGQSVRALVEFVFRNSSNKKEKGYNPCNLYVLQSEILDRAVCSGRLLPTKWEMNLN